MKPLKIYINNKVKMSEGKLAAQAVHAALMYYGIEHGAVIVLKASPNKIGKMRIQIRDAGKTEIESGTLTAGCE